MKFILMQIIVQFNRKFSLELIINIKEFGNGFQDLSRTILPQIRPCKASTVAKERKQFRLQNELKWHLFDVFIQNILFLKKNSEKSHIQFFSRGLLMVLTKNNLVAL